MSDEEDYNSEEDVDYVPSDGELGSEEENSGDEEDLSVLADDAGTNTDPSKKARRKRPASNHLAPRKRKGGIKLADPEGEEVAEDNVDPENAELAKRIREEAAAKKAEKEKKKADDLWASFKSDVKPTSKSSSTLQPAARSVSQAKPKSSLEDEKDTASVIPSPASETTPAAAAAASGKVTITKVFDFAGEEIKITKEVAVDSKEARSELKKQETDTAAASAAAPRPLVGSNAPVLKRPAVTGGGLGNVLGKIGKKQKMGTLDKSKMDWESFKKKEGIEEDLKIHNKGKDGYIERMAFLNRTDVRQFEIERDLRLSKTGKR